MRVITFSLALALVLPSCTDWPSHGYGGAAEFFPVPGNSRPEQDRLIAAEQELIVLRELGGEQYFPAKLQIAQLQWIRAARALSGNFIKAARVDLAELETTMSAMRRALGDKFSGPVKVPAVIARRHIR